MISPAGADARLALVHVPAAARQAGMPLVLMFHGYLDSAGFAQDMTDLSDQADRSGFLVAYLQAAGEVAKWDLKGPSDIAFVQSLLATTEADPCVDSTRIYVVGFSMGGGMATAVACRLADRVSAAAAVSGTYGPNWAEPCNPARPVPIVAFHGLNDDQVPYAGGPIDDGSNPDLPDVIGVEGWAGSWAERNGCSGSGAEQPSIGAVEPVFWDDCAAPVHLYRVTDGGHSWPGTMLDIPRTNGDISATELIWQFVSRFDLTEN